MSKQQIDLDRYLQWKYQTIANMTKEEFSQLMKLLTLGVKK